MANPTLQANFSANTAGFTQGVSVLRQKLTELNTQMEQNKQEIKTANSEIRSYRRELEQLKKDTNNGATATAEQARRMQELRDGIATATARLGTLRTTEQDLRADIRQTNDELRNQQSTLEQVTSNAATMGDVLKASLYSSAIQSALSKLSGALKSAASYCYSVGTSFEAAMSQVEAVSGAAGADLEALTAKAKELGATTRFSATEAASAMNYMAMAGWDAQQMLDGIGGVMSLAAAAGGDLAETSDIVTDAITAFGLKAEDVGHFSDVLAAASSNANTNVSMMGETFKYCAPIAGALGFSIEDVSEAIGLMANSGIKSTMAGTALRTTFTKLSEGVKLSGQALGEVEIKTSNADGSMRSLKEILTDIRAAFSQLTESEKSQAAESIAGKNAMSGFLALMNAGEEDVNKLRTAIESCDGASANMADTMTNNTAGAVTIMKSALESLGIAVYDKFGDEIRDSVEGITDIFTDLTDRIESGDLDEVFERVAESVGNAAEQLVEFGTDALPKAIEGLANIISFLVEYRNVVAGVITTMVTFKGAMALGKTLVTLGASIKGVVKAMSAAKTATEALTAAQAANNAVAAANPYVAVASAVMALVGGITALIMTTDNATESVKDLIDNSEKLTQEAQKFVDETESLEDIKERYEEITRSTDDTVDKEKELKALQDELSSQFEDVAAGIDLVTGAYDEQIKSLDILINRTDEYSRNQARQAYQNAKDAEEEKTQVLTGSYATSGALEEIYNSLKGDFKSTTSQAVNEYIYGMMPKMSGTLKNGYSFEGSYEDKKSDLEMMYNALISKYIETGNQSYNDAANLVNAQIDEIEKGMNQKNEAYDILSKINGWDDVDTTAWDDLIKKYGRKLTPEEIRGASAGYNQSGYGTYGYTGGFIGTDTSGSAVGSPEWIEEQKKKYKYMYDVGELDSDTYYGWLEYIRNNYYTKDSDEWRDLGVEIYRGRNKGGKGGSDNELENEYTAQEKLLKWKLDMGYITEEEYYRQLAALRDTYLDETSDKWRAATLSIHKYQLKQSEKSLDKLKDQYNAAISAIDDRIKQRQRDREDEDLNKQISDIERQLEYARLDDYSRQQLEQKKRELLREKEDTEWERDQEDQKDTLDTVYTMAKEAYETGSQNLQEALQTASLVFQAIGTGAENTASTVSTVTNYNSLSFAMSAVSQTADQIANAVIKAISSAL